MPDDRKKTIGGKPVPYEEVLNGLPASRRARIKKETNKLAAEYRLQKSLEALSMNESELAALLEEWQIAVPDGWKGRDLKIATLSRYVEALGGKLHLEAKFPGQPGVKLDATVGLADNERLTANA